MDQQTKERAHSHIPGLFSNSNIFVERSNNYQPNVRYYLVFSTCDQELLTSIYEGLLLKKEHSFGGNTITIHTVTIQPDKKVWTGKKLMGQTPIVISLDDQVSKKFNISPTGKPLYRVKEHGFEVWVRQLHKNIIRKYALLCKQGYIQRLTAWDKELVNVYDNENRELFDEFCLKYNFFSGYKYKKSTVSPYKEGFIVGSVWDLVIANDINGTKVLKYVLPIGIGERCTAGFGWMK